MLVMVVLDEILSPSFGDVAGVWPGPHCNRGAGQCYRAVPPGAWHVHKVPHQNLWGHSISYEEINNASPMSALCTCLAVLSGSPREWWSTGHVLSLWFGGVIHPIVEGSACLHKLKKQ